MVIFQTPGGSPGYNQFESLDEAVSFVEQLRNERDVSNARIFALEEVKFEYKPYFRVELQALTAGAPVREPAHTPAPVAASPGSTAPTAAPLSPSPTVPPAAPVQPEPVGAGAQTGSLSGAPGAGAFNPPGVDANTVEVPAPPVPPASAPVPPSEQPAGSSPVRRGLFGR